MRIVWTEPGPTNAELSFALIGHTHCLSWEGTKVWARYCVKSLLGGKEVEGAFPWDWEDKGKPFNDCPIVIGLVGSPGYQKCVYCAST